MNAPKTRLSRRNFLLAVGAGGAAGAAAVVSKSTTPAAVAKGKQTARGYHVTEHVQNYYRTTKV